MNESPLPMVLVVDDRTNMLRLMQKVLRTDAEVLTAERGNEALRLIERHPVSVVLCDLKMPDISGLDVLKSARQLKQDFEFILMTAHGSVPTAVDAMKLGAYDYLTKPFEPETARAVVLRALSRAATNGGHLPRNTTPIVVETPAEELEVLPGLIGKSQVMRDLSALVRKIANSDSTALILGETGSGKERIARAIHSLSARASQRFIALNAAAVPADLLESELFGYARGSFSGAVRDRAGLFEEAHRGTLFLDEIGEMRPSLQAKLTRAIEERAVRRLGESRERPIDVRLIAATHRDLAGMVKSGGFREDLWYRLNVALAHVPPLRERREDIEPLALYFLRELAGALPGRKLSGFTSAATEALRAHGWPGNVRQLRASVERACVMGNEANIDVVDLPPEVRVDPDELATLSDLARRPWQEAMERARDEAARRYLLAVLKRSDGKVAAAALHAGVERESFYRLLRKHGLKPDDPDPNE